MKYIALLMVLLCACRLPSKKERIEAANEDLFMLRYGDHCVLVYDAGYKRGAAMVETHCPPPEAPQ